MPKSEKALKRRIIEQNISRTHHRPLDGHYSYNHILNVDLVEECLRLLQSKDSPVRVLDIGCGDGFALGQLKACLAQKGFTDQFDFFGMGLNAYDQMHIPKENFLRQGVFGGRLTTAPFDLIISVYTFQYVWHKLESIELIHNQLLADNGKAIIHFPGYLVSFSERTIDILHTEVTGNTDFAGFIQRSNTQEESPPLKYRMIPYYSDDEDCELFTEFGNLSFQKDASRKMDFKAQLTAFGIYDDGFMFNSPNKNLSYVTSVYDLKSKAGQTPAPAKGSGKIPLCRIVTLPTKYNDKLHNFHMAIHPRPSRAVIGIYPAAKDDLTGNVVPYQKMAMELLRRKVGAVVRCNGLYDPSTEFHAFNDYFVHLFLDYILENASDICGHTTPEVYLMGYSTGGSAIASIASEYNEIKKLLLIAPSFDSDKELLRHNMNHFGGELYIVTGDRDDIVLPEQVAWFYHQAEQARVRKFVEFDFCEHSFNGERNQMNLLNAPL
ncbi:MAG: class I SAM-dependent methyltransferase, partial [Anaerolineae bacterium]|nr:class I SAM-dependent methyltransferase [Anaerolineae bacterium]